MTHYTDYTISQRGALVVWWLAHTAVLTVPNVAAVLGLSERATVDALTLLACVIPIGADVDGWTRIHGKPPVAPPTSQFERAAVLAWALACGARLTRTDAGALVGLDCAHAARLLDQLANVLPIYLDGGTWQTCWADAPWEPEYKLESGRCFRCGGVDGLRTGIVQGWPVLWCRRCARAYRALRDGAR